MDQLNVRILSGHPKRPIYYRYRNPFSIQAASAIKQLHQEPWLRHTNMRNVLEFDRIGRWTG